MNTAVTRPAIASTKSASRFSPRYSASAGQRTSAPEPCIPRNEVRERREEQNQQEQPPTVIAVNPVLPPAAVPAADRCIPLPELHPPGQRKRCSWSGGQCFPTVNDLPIFIQQVRRPATARIVPVASNTAVITSAERLAGLQDSARP